jgi:allophanate hydrolase subunit 2
VGVAFLGAGGELWAGGGDGQDAEQVGVADGAMGEVDNDPEMGREVTMKGTVALEAMDDGRERLLGGRDNARLEQEVAQLCDPVRVESRHFLELYRLQHALRSYLLPGHCFGGLQHEMR